MFHQSNHRGTPSDYVDYLLDIETVDVRSTSKIHGQKNRAPDELIGILEMAVHRRKNTRAKFHPFNKATGYTDLIPQHVLAQYANKDVPRSFLETLTTHEAYGPGSRFSQNMLADSSNTLRRVLNSSIEAAGSGKYPKSAATDLPAKFHPTAKYLGGLASQWEKDIASGSAVRVHAWNASFDISTILENVYTLGDKRLQEKYERIVGDKHLFQVKDLSDPVKQAMADRMMREPTYAPQYLNKAKVNEALSQGTKIEEVVKSIKGGQSSYVARNEALSTFWQDVSSTQKGQSVKSNIFLDRLHAAYDDTVLSQIGGKSRERHRQVIGELSSGLNSVAQAKGDEFGAFRRTTENLRRHKHFGFMEQLMKKAYASPGNTSIFGSGVHHLGPKPEVVSGLITGMDMVSGWSLDEWAGLLKVGGDEGAHVALVDNVRAQAVSERVATMVQHSQQAQPASNRSIDQLNAIMDEASISSMSKKASGLKPAGIGLTPPIPEATKATKDAINNLSNMGKRGILGKGNAWLKGTALLSGLYLFSDWNRDNGPQGIRQSMGKHDQIHGMTPSGDTLLTPFGSGRDALSQMLGSMQMDSVQTLRSSMLGYRGDHLIHSLTGTKNRAYSSNPGLSERGTQLHSQVEEIYMNSGAAQAAEYLVYAPDLDVQGHVDLILPSGIPLEIKSVEGYDELQKLNKPRDPHISQANFYAYALDQPYAILGYAARNNPNVLKYFMVERDDERLMSDVQAVRTTMESLRQEGRSLNNYSVYQQVTDVIANFQQQAISVSPVSPGQIPGMIQPTGYHAIKSLGDYKTFNIGSRYRRERPNTDTFGCTGNSKVRSQGSKAFNIPNHNHHRPISNRSRAIRSGSAA